MSETSPIPSPRNDILAAIRKLVDGAGQQEGGPADIAPEAVLAPASAPVPPAQPAEPLLLTPSLRIDTPAAAEETPFQGRAPQFGAGEDGVADPVAQAPAQVAVDDQMLRKVVAEVLRSELQGELGERITRNVRKLVHREVLRASTGRDLD